MNFGCSRCGLPLTAKIPDQADFIPLPIFKIILTY